MTYLSNHTGPTPQTEALPGQSRNNAGGFSWTLDDFGRLRRFLILGSEGGTYYATERKLTTENFATLASIAARGFTEGGRRAVDMIAEVSESGVAPKNDPALYALAYLSKKGDDNTRAYALAQLPRVARIGTHVLHFADFVDKLGGWGRGTRRAIADWYRSKSPDDLAYQLVKYQSRDGWSNRDVLRMAHPRAKDPVQDALFAWAVGKTREGLRPRLVDAFEEAKTASVGRVIELIRDTGLPREAVPSQHLNDPAVWQAWLLGAHGKMGMGLTALVRNLGKMTAVGAIGTSGNAYLALTKVVMTLRDETIVQRSNIHPIQVLSALKTYAQGHGERGSNSWNPIQGVVDALDAAFYSSFQSAPAAGKSTLLALDISGSMFSGTIAGVPGLHPAMAAGAMAMVTAAREPQTWIRGFTTRGARTSWYESQGTQLEELALSPRRRLDDNLKVMAEASRRMGGTDCSMPMEWAIENKVPVDTFVVYTDNETYAGKRHPSEALRDYRRKLQKPEAKLIVVGMTATQFTIADPSDPGSLDVVGFDASAPAVMADFSRGA